MESTSLILTALVPLACYLIFSPGKTKQAIKDRLSTISWYNLGLVGIFCLSAILRFKDLGRFNQLVFDEVHFVNFAQKYLKGLPIFDAHPPLSKYLIAFGIWIAESLSIGQEVTNDKTGSPLSPIGYRWMNAFIGSLIPVMIASLAYKLSQRRAFALVAGYFAALDGLFIIESRYALIEVYIAFFGISAQVSLFNALQINNKWHRFWLVVAGVGFGAAVAAKWNGLGFWGPIIALWVGNEIIQRMPRVQGFLRNLGFGASMSFKYADGRAELNVVVESIKSSNTSTQPKQKLPSTPASEIADSSASVDRLPILTSFTPFIKESPFASLARLNLIRLICYLGIVPAIFYTLQWIPHLTMNSNYGFFGEHDQLMKFHKNLETGHTYCSSWSSWPLMLRPICFYYQHQHAKDDLPEVFEDIHSIGNPILWWCSTAALVPMLLIVLREAWRWMFRSADQVSTQQDEILPSTKSWIPFYLFLNWSASIFPYTLITRCAFIYHYMPSSIYAEIALAWMVDNWLRSQKITLRLLAVIILLAVGVSFVYFSPIFYGLPLGRNEYYGRMWLKSWI